MEYMSVKEAAELWGYSESTIRQWCRSGKIVQVTSAKKDSNRWKIPKEALCPRPVKK